MKTEPTKASVTDFLEKIADPERRADCLKLVKLLKRVTGYPPTMWASSMVGFGSYHYKYPTGNEGDWFLTGFSPRKREITLYIMSGFEPLEDELAALGKHKLGKSCLYIKQLADIDLDVLEKMVRLSLQRLKKASHVTRMGA